MKDYWTSDCDDAIQAYYYSTTTEEKNRIIDRKLKCALIEMARRAMTSCGMTPDRDSQHDIVVHLVTKAMPKIKEEKLKGSLQYLWTTAVNYTLTYIVKQPGQTHTHITLESQKVFHFTGDDLRSNVCPDWVRSSSLAVDPVDPVDLDEAYEMECMHKRVLDEIDKKLDAQKVVNATNSVFLMLLKQYLLDNDYDVKGFGKYIREMMHLSLTTYRAIAGRLGFRTKEFNEE